MSYCLNNSLLALSLYIPQWKFAIKVEFVAFLLALPNSYFCMHFNLASFNLSPFLDQRSILFGLIIICFLFWCLSG